jgi:hypothetical protein
MISNRMECDGLMIAVVFAVFLCFAALIRTTGKAR